LRKLIKPIGLENDSLKFKDFKDKNFVNLTSNLYLLTHQLVKNLPECEIEDLFDDTILKTTLHNKTFERDSKKFDEKLNYGKAAFADYISKNYNNIDFKEFKPLLDYLNEIVNNCTST